MDDASMVIAQQMAFLAKFQELFGAHEGSPHAKNQLRIERLAVLLAIMRHPGLSQVELARQLTLSEMAVGRNVRALDKTFGVLRVDQTGKGPRRIYLNSRGEEIVAELFSVFLAGQSLGR
jgi:DNA-binding MarR family transcriptional regulator